MLMLLKLIEVVFHIYSILIIVYVFMSWLPQVQQSAFGVFLGKIVEPYLAVFRRFIPSLGMIDISPIVALIALQFVQRGLVSLLLFIIYGNFGSLF